MKYLLAFCFIFFTVCFFAQEKFSKKISFITDNDLYVSKVKDRYYTNGMFLNYSYLSKIKKDNLEKKIFKWQIGHEMFTPHKSVVQSISEHDRPFAGHLFGSFGIQRVYKSNAIVNTTIQLGVIGSNAYGEELQDFIHDIYGFTEAVGWKYQIKNAISLNFNADYTRFLAKDNSNFYDISWTNSIKIGTVYTNIASGFYARLGLKPLAKFVNSLAFNTNLNDENTSFKREVESFFYLKPTIKYALYDATLQGSFLNTSSPVTKELIPFVFKLEAGFKFTANRYIFGYTFNYNTNQSKDLRHTNGNAYGTIVVHYLFN